MFQELERRGKRNGVDFTFQSSFFGGRLEKGGLIVDFVFSNPPDLAFNIQGVFYHYEQGAAVKSRDVLTRAALAGQGLTLIFLDEDDILQDVEFVVREGLQFRDHSRLGGGR